MNYIEDLLTGKIEMKEFIAQLKTINDLGVYYYTNDRGSCEVDFIVDTGEQIVPFEAKLRST